MFPITDYAVFQRRQAELLKQAEIERLLRQAESDRPEALPIPRRGASWPGIHLVKWGRKLEQFGTPDNRQCATSVYARSSSL
jgi:hypothetical protein